MRIHLASCILVLLVAHVTWAQDKPDFSGNWILVSPTDPPDGAARTLIVRETFTRESVKGTPIDPPLIRLAVERRLNTSVRSDLYTIGTVGGTVGNAGPGGQTEQTRSSTDWNGDSLVIHITDSGRPLEAGAESEHTEVWSLGVQGALSLTVTDRRPGTEARTTSLLYHRRP
jgi:hypothetical protein